MFNERGEWLKDASLTVEEGNVSCFAFGPGDVLAVGYEGVLMVLDSDEETGKDWREGQRDDGDEKCCDQCPEDEGVPLP